MQLDSSELACLFAILSLLRGSSLDPKPQRTLNPKLQRTLNSKLQTASLSDLRLLSSSLQVCHVDALPASGRGPSADLGTSSKLETSNDNTINSNSSSDSNSSSSGNKNRATRMYDSSQLCLIEFTGADMYISTTHMQAYIID